MRLKWFFLVLLLFLPVTARADGFVTNNFASAAAGTSNNLTNTGIAYHKLTWSVQGTITVCTVALDSSADGVTWTAGGVIAGQTCTTNGSSAVVNVIANFIRINMTALTGSGLVSVTWNGYVNNPGGGGGGGGPGTGTQYALANWATTSTLGNACTPPTTNGTYNILYTVTTSAVTQSTCPLVGLAARGVTGATSSDTVLYSDNNSVVEYEGTVAVAVALPTQTTLGNPNFFTVIDNKTTGASTLVTVTPATNTVNGAASIGIKQNQSCRFTVDPAGATNWLAICAALVNSVTPTQYNILRCYAGLGDGVNGMAAASYLQTNCYNNSGQTWTITRVGCFTDNAGTSTLAATNGAGTALLTGAVTCTAAAGGAAGTQSGTTTIANGDVIKFTFAADGTSKQTEWFVSLVQ